MEALRRIIAALALICAVGYYLDAKGAEHALDEKTKTFPLGEKFPDMVSACFTEESAAAVVSAIARKDEAAGLIFNVRGCFNQIVPITYNKRIAQVRVEGSYVNVYRAQVGSMTVFVITDWSHRGTQL